MQDKLIEAEIDDGILGVVLVLNDAGVKTFSSCQGGGYGWGHGYLRPIVCFDGDDSEGERAEKIATDAGYQVFQVQRVWYTRDGERVGPFWEMEFVAGAACRAPKDRATVRAHDAPETEPWWEKEWAESFKKYREYAAQHGCRLGGDMLEFVLQDALAYRAAHDAGTDEGLPTDRRPCPNCGRSDGWHYALGHPPLPVGDCRKIVWMRDKDEMEWWGVRAYNHAEGYWQSNSREESSTVLFWMETPHSPHYPPASHAAESTAQLDAEDPAEPVEGHIVPCYHCGSTISIGGRPFDPLLCGPCYNTRDVWQKSPCVSDRASVLCREDTQPAMSLAIIEEQARKGYVKMQDVEKAIWDQFGTWIGTTNFKDGLSEIRARLAPKPEPSLQDEIAAVLKSHEYKVTSHTALAAELAALVERRTK